MSTELEFIGYKRLSNDPLWTTRAVLESPQNVVQVHKNFIAAGADIIETCTYQASMALLEEQTKMDRKSAIDVLHTAVKLCRQAIHEQGHTCSTKVAGSIGPYAVVLHDGSEYEGSYFDHIPSHVVVEYYVQQAQALIDGGVDILAFETIPSEKEAELIIMALMRLPPISNWISLSCKDGLHTRHGDKFSAVCQSLGASNVVSAIGINCTAPQNISSLLDEAQNAFNKPLVVYPNSGEGWISGQGWDGKSQLGSMISLSETWLNKGVRILGGCCRVNAQHLKYMAEVVHNHSINNIATTLASTL